MARKNIMGTSFLGLSLKPDEEKQVKVLLKDKDLTAKQLMRYLLRNYLKASKNGN